MMQEYERRFEIWLDNLKYVAEYNAQKRSHWVSRWDWQDCYCMHGSCARTSGLRVPGHQTCSPSSPGRCCAFLPFSLRLSRGLCGLLIAPMHSYLLPPCSWA